MSMAEHGYTVGIPAVIILDTETGKVTASFDLAEVDRSIRREFDPEYLDDSDPLKDATDEQIDSDRETIDSALSTISYYVNATIREGK